MTDQLTTELINSLLANMCGDVDRIPDLPDVILPEDLPADLPLQREMMGVYNDCSRRGISPTRKNLLYGLTVLYDHKDDGIEQRVDAILEHRTEFGDVASPGHYVNEEIRKSKARAALARGLETVGGPEDVFEAQLDAVIADLVNMRTSFDDTYLDRDMPGMGQYLAECFARREKIRKEGLPPGPSLKFKGFVGETDERGNPKVDGKAPHLRWGQTTLVTGREGTGKTTFGCTWAEHNAWEKGYDVLYLHNETEQDIIGDRMIARNLLIPANYLSAGRLNFSDDDDPIAKQVKGFLKWTALPTKPGHDNSGKKVERDSGALRYVYCPGWDVHKIAARIRLERQRADARGRGLLVFVDYYNLIDLSTVYGDSKADRLGQVAFHLRECIKQENMRSQKYGGVGAHCIVFAQESNDGKETYAYGSKQIGQYSQLIISIRRNEVDQDWLMVNGKKPVLDALGNKRYWHRAGEWGGITDLVIVKGNDNSRGTVAVWVENRMFRVQDPENV